MAGARGVVDLAGLQALLGALRERGYTVIGPTLRDGAIVLAPVGDVADLPCGVVDEQAPGHYRVDATGGEELFGFAAPASSWKAFLFPSRRRLWQAGADGAPQPSEPGPTPLALLGVRSCDLHALAVHDTVLAGRRFADPDYVARRRQTFVVAVTCGHPGGTCFCASMGTGPRPESGYDLLLTELSQDGHRFVVESGSRPGAELLASLPTRPVAAADDRAAAAVAGTARDRMGRAVDTGGLRDVLYAAAADPRWDEVAQRCLSCGNCTYVCPTCFCVSTREVVPLDGPLARDRVWDSCFTTDHSYLHGGPVRGSTSARYRQWLTHKFAAWVDQFGTSGCVGCGRCITWCPAGIDVTEELAALRAGRRPEEAAP